MQKTIEEKGLIEQLQEHMEKCLQKRHNLHLHRNRISWHQMLEDRGYSISTLGQKEELVNTYSKGLQVLCLTLHHSFHGA